ncbi:hypothetical protein H0E87_023728 [Populus deltoides]|uniref:DNA replication licensing factor MCM2 n=1 Tax=Populus deltoides TaxID=3696 RepID=A0A8T2XI45_POPDE|nr:hypothetical protein H0E87_023728 [Populus deltoides]
MEEVAMKVVFDLHPNYRNFHQKIDVCITNLPVYDQIRNIGQIHLNTMICVGGVVTRQSGVFPQLQEVKYDCNKCGAILGSFFQNSYSEVKKLTLQESPGIAPAGRLPRYKEVILLNDLIDCARPGEEIEGIKTALALAMFRGQEKNVEGKHRLRGDINVLLLGEPGITKSQFLKYVERTGQRAMYTTGKGVYVVSLTTAVHKDPVT